MADKYKVITYGPRDHEVVLISTGTTLKIFSSKKAAEKYRDKLNRK